MAKLYRAIAAFALAATVWTGMATAAAIDDITAPLRPVEMTATPDTKRAVTKAIEAATGGELTVKGGDGTVYRLTVPADGLLDDVEIIMTPLASIKGVPGQSQVFALDLQPAGLRFFNPATLEIIPAKPPRGEPVAIRTAGTAEAPRARAAIPVDGVSKIAIFHFSGAGLAYGNEQTADALLPQNEPSMAEQLAAIDAVPMPQAGSPEFKTELRDYIGAQVGRLIQLEKNGTYSSERATGHINGWMEVADLLAERSASAAAGAAASGDPAQMPKMIEAVQDLIAQARNHELLGHEAEGHRLSELAMDLIRTFAESFASSCKERATDVKTTLGLARTVLLLGMDESLADRLQYECTPRSIVAKLDLVAFAYEFRHCGADSAVGRWTVNLSGPIYEGKGEGTISADGTGSWSLTGTMQGQGSVEQGGALKFVGGFPPMLDFSITTNIIKVGSVVMPPATGKYTAFVVPGDFCWSQD